MIFPRRAAVRFLTILTTLALPAPARPGGPDDDLSAQLRKMDAAVIARSGGQAGEPSKMLRQDARVRLRAAAVRENAAWQKVQTVADWEAFRDARLLALRTSLGPFPPSPRDVKVRVTGKRSGPGYRIENLVF